MSRPELKLGVKSDPVEYRYTYDWLFDLMAGLDVRYLQLGSFFELYEVDDRYFTKLRSAAERRGIHIKSCFTSHRELGGFMTGDPFLEKVARRGYERLIDVAATVGADYAGTSAGAVYRDTPERKSAGMQTYLGHMKELMFYARERGLAALTIEPMSSLFEPPSLPAEIDEALGVLSRHHKDHADTTVPVFLCGDVSHGVADEMGKVIHDSLTLFEHEIPVMAEFHIKNTDGRFEATFGFGPQDNRRGAVNLAELRRIIERNSQRWPVDEIVGYLELGGPKLGRDYSDKLLGPMLSESLSAIKAELF